MLKQRYQIDGAQFRTLDEFYEIISDSLIPGVAWGKNLDAFNDILRGGFGTPENGFILEWTNSNVSKSRLGYGETVNQLERKLRRCHRDNRQRVQAELEAAKDGTGPTVFDWLVEIIRCHGPGGEESEDGVELVFS